MDQVGSRWEGGEGEGPFSGLGRGGGVGTIHWTILKRLHFR